MKTTNDKNELENLIKLHFNVTKILGETTTVSDEELIEKLIKIVGVFTSRGYRI
jgi:hypothetical protein